MAEPLSPAIAAVAAVMDEIGQCRNPMPCELCRQRMQSILDMGAAAERERLRPVLADAVDGMEDMLGYIPEHFRRKGGHQGYLDRAKAALAAPGGPLEVSGD